MDSSARLLPHVDVKMLVLKGFGKVNQHCGVQIREDFVPFFSDMSTLDVELTFNKPLCSVRLPIHPHELHSLVSGVAS